MLKVKEKVKEHKEHKVNTKLKINPFSQKVIIYLKALRINISIKEGWLFSFHDKCLV